MENLDLYAKIEPMIGFYEAYENLYENYLQLLEKFDVKTLLDVGCGNGKLLEKLSKRYQARGIDLSAKMVEIARAKGLDASQTRLEELTDSFDALLAVADVLNYMPEKMLQPFLEAVDARLESGGIFLCDINTLHGFEEVAAGSMSVDEADRFLAIDAEFEERILRTDITLFEQEGTCYKKEQATIFQYYHTIDTVESLSPLKLIGLRDINLFSMESDKTILIFQKE
jgi:predicted TPR repeat methyltransferase